MGIKPLLIFLAKIIVGGSILVYGALLLDIESIVERTYESDILILFFAFVGASFSKLSTYDVPH